MRRAHALASAAVLPQELLTKSDFLLPAFLPMCTQVCGTRVDECGGVSKAAEWRARNSWGTRGRAHVSAFLALGSLALTLIVVVGRVLLLLCCNVNRTNSVELLTLLYRGT